MIRGPFSSRLFFVLLLAGGFWSGQWVVRAPPVSVAGDTFVLVATGTGPQKACMVSDPQGRIYVGNNSNGAGIPLQLFRPELFSGTPIPFENFGPVCNDADGLTIGNGFLYVSDIVAGVRKISIADGSDTIFNSSAGRTAVGSPLVFRPTDGHIFSAYGGLGGPKYFDEFDPAGVFVRRHETVDEVETLVIDPATGLLYYAPFGASVRRFDPSTGEDILIGMIDGTIDQGLALDEATQNLFVGTANGANQGLVYTLNLTNGAVRLFASGFAGCLGILRDPVSRDLYFLESQNLYRLVSTNVDRGLAPFLRIEKPAQTGEGFQIFVTRAPNTPVVMEACEELPGWAEIGEVIVNSEATVRFVDPDPIRSFRFYRARVGSAASPPN